MVRHDVGCKSCGYEIEDFAFPNSPTDDIRCLECGGTAEIIYRSRKKNAQWSDRDACVVFRDASGKLYVK